MHPLLVLLLALVIAGFTWLMTVRLRPVPKPKRFGLKEAEAAAQYISTADAAQPVMAVIVGVLGYENTVAGDLTEVAAFVATLNVKARDKVDHANWEISDLKREIDQLQAQINAREAELTEKRLVAALFTA